MVSAADIVIMGQSQIGHPRSGAYDALNGDHAWAYWCLAYQESTHRNMGLDVTPQWNAVGAGRSYDLSGGPPPFGASVFFDENFYYPDGHTGISMGDGRLLGTLTDGSGVGYRYWNNATYGFMGWCYLPGVTPAGDSGTDGGSEPAPPRSFRPPNNPHETDTDIILAHGMLRFWVQVDIGGDPYTVLGFPVANERDATIIDADGTARTRTIQEFERLVLVFQPENKFPWDIVAMPRSSLVA
jgi:hypothetical protein